MVQTFYTQRFCTRHTEGIYAAYYRTDPVHIKFCFPSDHYVLFRYSPGKTRRRRLATEFGLNYIFNVDCGEEIEARARRVQDEAR